MKTRRKDIESKDDLSILVEAFYRRALQDDIIGFFFTDVANLDLPAHMPKIVDFWAMQLFGDRTYQGNPFLTHKLLNTQARLTTDHFKHWAFLFITTVDALFEGKNAEQIKKTAQAIAHKMPLALMLQTTDGDDAYQPESGVSFFDQVNKDIK